MSSSWYFVRNGERVGPVSREELDARVAEGVVTGATLVWRAGMSAWARACEMGELGVPPPLAPPPLPPAMPRPVAPTDGVMPQAEPMPASGLEFAGFWQRFAAKMIDGLVLYGFGVMVERAVAHLWFHGRAPLLTENLHEWLWFAVHVLPINMLIAVLYSVVFIALHEATPGKRMLGLRVIRADGGRVGWPRVVGRYFAEQVSGIVFFAGYVMAAFDEEKRSLHDVMCDTRVVRGPREPERGRAGAGSGGRDVVSD